MNESFMIMEHKYKINMKSKRRHIKKQLIEYKFIVKL